MPPVAKIVPHAMTVHGDTRIDNYFWLRDRKDPDTIAYLEAENLYTQEKLHHTEDLQATLYAEMLGRIQQTDLSVPVKRDEYFYYTRTEEGKQYAIYCRKKGSALTFQDAPEDVLLDCNLLAEEHKYFRLGAFIASPNHRLLAHSVDFEGDEKYTVRVKNLDTGELLADEIPNTSYTLEWANDNATFFYTTLDEALRPYKVFRHTLGVKEDSLIYHEPDERFTLDLSSTRSRAYIFINIDSSLTSEIRYLKCDQPVGHFRVLLPRVYETEYDATHHGDSFFIRTNDGAKGFRVVEAPVADPAKENWKEIIQGREGVTIESVTAFEKYLVTEERHRGLTQICMRELSSGERHSIDFPEPVYTAELSANAEFNTELLRFHYASLVTPASVYDYNMETRLRELKKQQAVLGGYDPQLYRSERIYATARDGVEVPVSLVYKNSFVRDGRAPMLLYGYGSYGISIDPSFSSDRLSLLDRGFVYAIAHIRGGMDLGKPWHETGRLLKKKNTFTDFIACAERLIAEKYTSPARLGIMGRSAGGLLMAGVVNLRPDLFAAVVAGVPFVDSLNTALDATLPLTVGEYEEFGNPGEKEYYDYMKSYAPYENVTQQVYPAIFVTAGLNDPRVSYWEPAKWVAKLRAANTGDRPLLLRTNLGSGHFGASGRYEYLKETAIEYAFLLDVLC
ncbi:MAG: S9 family peptidase [Acidobacteriota bacterium]